MVEPLQSTGRSTGYGRFDAETVRESRGWFFALGLGFMVLGGLAILLPFAASLVTSLVIGWLMVVGGLLQGFHAVQNRRWKGWGWALAGAVVYVVAGGLVVAYPITGTLTLTLTLAAFFVVNGVIKVVRALQHRVMKGWGLLLFDGLLSVALGVMIMWGWPGTAVWALGLLVGLDLLFGGASMLMIGLAAGSPRETHTAGAHT